MKTLLSLQINDQPHEVYTSIHKTLLEVLREDLNLTGTKHGCELGECGACTVLIDGEPMLSCLILPIEVQGRVITTIEGLAEGNTPHPLQTAFANMGAVQCGFCTPAILLTASAMLATNPHPTRPEICENLSGNLCRCTGYTKIIEAIEQVISGA